MFHKAFSSTLFIAVSRELAKVNQEGMIYCGSQLHSASILTNKAWQQTCVAVVISLLQSTNGKRGAGVPDSLSHSYCAKESSWCNCATDIKNDSSHLLNLETPSETCREVCLLDDFISCQVDNINPNTCFSSSEWRVNFKIKGIYVKFPYHFVFNKQNGNKIYWLVKDCCSLISDKISSYRLYNRKIK